MAQDQFPLSQSQLQLLSNKKITVEVSPFEAIIIKVMRKMKFGNLTIHFANGIPLRYTLGASQVVDPTKNDDSILDILEQEEKDGE